MNAPSLSPLDPDFASQWQARYPNTPPVAFLLRAAFPSRWLRVHSLPAGKRYADTPTEQAELLRRHQAVATEVLGDTAEPCAFLILAPCDGRGRHGLGRRSGLGADELPQVLALPEALWHPTEGAFGERMALHGGVGRWDWARHERFVRAVAGDAVEGMVVRLADGQVYAPYDGGADLFFATETARDVARSRYAEWLSARDDGM